MVRDTHRRCTLRSNPIGERVGSSRAARILATDIGDAGAVAFIRRTLLELFIIVSDCEHDYPRLIDSLAFEDIERVRRRDTDCIGPVGKHECSCLDAELLSRQLIVHAQQEAFQDGCKRPERQLLRQDTSSNFAARRFAGYPTDADLADARTMAMPVEGLSLPPR